MQTRRPELGPALERRVVPGRGAYEAETKSGEKEDGWMRR